MGHTEAIKKYLLALVGLVILAFALAWVYTYLRPASQEGAEKPPVESSIQKSDVDFSKAPEGFPSEIPIETGAKIVQNYNANTTEGVFQATRVFETTKTLNENFAIYQDFMKNNGWDIKSTTNQDNYKMLFAIKDGAQLQVSIDNNVSTKVKTVNISYTETKK